MYLLGIGESIHPQQDISQGQKSFAVSQEKLHQDLFLSEYPIMIKVQKITLAQT